jgi:alkanesulfonate monooxygenase SsuD/methylene tetrahydromethanopterin reductase-like flavin-dependent oxidoreductase (luciferase family)
MRISLSITNFSWPDGPVAIAERLAATARAAEAAGLDTVWVPDHLLQSDPASSPDEPMLEAYTTLGFLAGQTARIRLGTLVAGATFRAPALLVTGQRRTLRLVAEYADACNLFDIPDGGLAVRRGLDVLAQHCAEVGRSFEQIERTITTALQPDEPVDRFLERCGKLGELGIEHVIVITRGRPWTDDGVNTLGAAAAQLAQV